MFPYEINPDSSSAIGQSVIIQPSADFPFVHFAALQSSELGRETNRETNRETAASARTQQLSGQQESNSPAVRPQDFLTTPLIWLLPLWGAIVWLLLLGTASEAWKLLRYNPTQVKPGQRLRVPCKNCRFFSSNFYLKCAVRPSDALTDRAIDCSDFCQKTEPGETSIHAKRDVRH